MLRKSEIERKLRRLQTEAKELGLEISEFTVLDSRVITELEKRDIGKDRTRPRKPIFKSKANWKNLKLGPDDVGSFEGIKFVILPYSTEEKKEETVKIEKETVKIDKSNN